jgi:hypothetical protein
MSTPSWVPAMVAIGEDMGPYAAQIVADQRCNGWVVPRFTREVAQQVVADLNAINTAAINTGEDVDPFEAELARFDGDDILIIQAPGTDEEQIVERVTPDAEGRYRLGGYRWCWSRVDAPPHRYRLYTLSVQFLGDDDPGRAATDAYQAIAALDPLVDLHQAQLRYDIADTTTVVAEVTCAADIPGEGICLRTPGHHGGCTRTSDRPALPHARSSELRVPDLPPGARLLSADEAVDLLVTGDHPQAGSATVVLDSALIDALRHGLIVACQLPNGQIAFTRPGTEPDQ